MRSFHQRGKDLGSQEHNIKVGEVADKHDLFLTIKKHECFRKVTTSDEYESIGLGHIYSELCHQLRFSRCREHFGRPICSSSKATVSQAYTSIKSDYAALSLHGGSIENNTTRGESLK